LSRRAVCERSGDPLIPTACRTPVDQGRSAAREFPWSAHKQEKEKDMRPAIVGAGLAAMMTGAAHADERSFDFSHFDSVSVAKGVTAIISVGGDYSVRAESTEEGLERVEIKLVKGDLRIGRKSNFQIGRAPHITVNVSLPALNALDVSTGSDTTATGVAANTFSMDASTGASLKISGQCDTLSLDVSTGASVDAQELQCKTASVDATTGGTATIFASASLSADAAFGGDVHVYGNPSQVSEDTAFGGDVTVEN
jgi:hypothetical protein